ncbi:MAG: succinate dehydrogenase, cytochrome b556 subunit [Gammaproteobacteria bacterium]
MAIQRPLSPHLQIYRWQLTSVTSILHRATGIFLALGALVLAWWLAALAGGPETFQRAHECLASGIGRLALLAWTYALFYHLCNGIRHLAWDAGKGFSLPAAYRSGYIVFAASVVLTAATWFVALSRSAQP